MCWHKWEKWTETARGELFKFLDVADLSKKLHVGQVSYQERLCAKCGRKQLCCEVARLTPSYEVQPGALHATTRPNEAVATQEAHTEVCRKAGHEGQ